MAQFRASWFLCSKKGFLKIFGVVRLCFSLGQFQSLEVNFVCGLFGEKLENGVVGCCLLQNQCDNGL